MKEAAVQRLKQKLRPGEVYRRADFEEWSTAVDRHLRLLTKDGTLKKLNPGLYYVPKLTPFGPVPPEDHDLITSFLKDDHFLLVSPNAYNSLGLGLTQLYNVTWVYNHKRRGAFKLGNRSFLFKLKAAFPDKITKEYLVVDLLNNLEELAEDSQSVVEQFKRNYPQFDLSALFQMVNKYGSGQTKRLVKEIRRSNHKANA